MCRSSPIPNMQKSLSGEFVQFFSVGYYRFLYYIYGTHKPYCDWFPVLINVLLQVMNVNFLSSFKVMISSRDFLNTICILDLYSKYDFLVIYRKEKSLVVKGCVTASIQTDLLFHQSNLSDQIRTFWKALSLRFILQLSKRKNKMEGNKEKFLET